jgi:hypothetical protein
MSWAATVPANRQSETAPRPALTVVRNLIVVPSLLFRCGAEAFPEIPLALRVALSVAGLTAMNKHALGLPRTE